MLRPKLHGELGAGVVHTTGSFPGVAESDPACPIAHLSHRQAFWRIPGRRLCPHPSGSLPVNNKCVFKTQDPPKRRAHRLGTFSSFALESREVPRWALRKVCGTLVARVPVQVHLGFGEPHLSRIRLFTRCSSNRVGTVSLCFFYSNQLSRLPPRKEVSYYHTDSANTISYM